ncbi:chemotaxis protein CheD [Jannaschia faecimaris]|nr:chemotaxis protein CheD [Jannaschia faecimaris]
MTMTATLGSCVGVILQDVSGRVGGLTHIFQCVDPGPAGGGAVVAEIEKLVNALMHEGVKMSVIKARVVGGARTLGRGRDVGGDIARVCLAFLTAEGIQLAASDLGGTRARRITYAPASGILTIAYPGDAVSTSAPPKSRLHGDPELF